MNIKITACIILIFLFIANISTVRAEPSVSAQSAILIEKSSGRVLYSKNADAKLPIASTTKILTALCAVDALGNDIDKIAEISNNAAGVEGSSMYLEPGEKMTVRELLYGLMLSSGNDASVAVAESVCGSVENFVELMNQTAARLGADSSHFTNPNGLPSDSHFSTAHDMAKITAAALDNPIFAETVKTKSYKIEGDGKAYSRTLTNHNKLLGMYEGCIGVKTGFTKAAGRCLVSAAEKNNMVLICVTLNAPNDWNDHISLLDYGFNTFEYKKIIDSRTAAMSIDVTGAVDSSVPVYPEKDLFYPLTSGEIIDIEAELYPEVSAPLSKGDTVGSIKLSLRSAIQPTETNFPHGIPLVVNSKIQALSVAKRKSFSVRFIHTIRDFFGVWLKLTS